MIKRRKPGPLIEEVDFADFFSEQEQRQIVNYKRRRVDPEYSDLFAVSHFQID